MGALGGAARAAEDEKDGGGRSIRATFAKEPLAGIVTLISIAGFTAAFVVYLLFNIGAGEPAWSRRTYLFAAVEAITFAAVGWLFGKEVHRERAETAEKRTDAAERKADDAQKAVADRGEEATKYRERDLSIKAAIRAARESHEQLAPHLQSLGPGGATLTASAGAQFDQLAAQAEALFPGE